MRHFNYEPDLTGLRILKSEDEQRDNFFHEEDPIFLIPDFNTEPECMWVSYLDFLERDHSKIIVEDGGEISLHKLINKESGLTKCIWTSFNVKLDNNPNAEDLIIEIYGYVVENKEGEFYFVATKVFEDSKIKSNDN